VLPPCMPALAPAVGRVAFRTDSITVAQKIITAGSPAAAGSPASALVRRTASFCICGLQRTVCIWRPRLIVADAGFRRARPDRHLTRPTYTRRHRATRQANKPLDLAQELQAAMKAVRDYDLEDMEAAEAAVQLRALGVKRIEVRKHGGGAAAGRAPARPRAPPSLFLFAPFLLYRSRTPCTCSTADASALAPEAAQR
jgi:hypothetical protein